MLNGIIKMLIGCFLPCTRYEGAAVGGVLQNLELAFAFTLDAVVLGEDIAPWAIVGT